MLDEQRKYIYFSIAFHVLILIVLTLGIEFSEPLAVLQQSNKQDVISAVVLGDTEKSRILPQKNKPPVTPKIVEKKEITPQPEIKKEMPIKKAEALPSPIKEDVIPLQKADKKKEIKKIVAEDKKKIEKIADDLLADIKKISDKKAKAKQKVLKAQFEKTLREEAEQSLRQALLNEDIKLKGTETREAQGEINKYKALIIQSISEHWVVPLQANKKLSCELMIRLAKNGAVLDVRITHSSGDPSLDSSARAAVFKASPLPVPSDTQAFEPFRQFVLKVKPENIL